MIKVKASNPETVTFWEVDPAHPGGEVFVSGAREVEVAETPAVHRRIASGDLVVVGSDEAPETPETPDVPADESDETPTADNRRKRK